MDNVPVLLSTFTLAMLHSVLPSHWLCFVLVGRAREWTLRRTLGVTVAAGLCHVLSTILLGVLAIVFARELVSEEMLKPISAGVLIGVGLIYLVLHLFHTGHHHAADEKRADRGAVAALLLTLFLSPCEAVIPLFLLAATGSVVFIAAMCVVVTVATVGVMLLLTSVAWRGVEAARLKFADRYEKLIIGSVLAGLGAGVLVLE